MSKPNTPAAAEHYKNFVDLLAVFSEAKRRLAAMQNELDEEFAEQVDGVRAEYADLQAKVSESTAAIEATVASHPEWFIDKRSVKTPYGTVKVTRTTKLEVPNEEATILLVQHAIEKGTAVPTLLRTEPKLNLEILEKLTDAELKAFRITRVPGESVKITEAKIDLGKAVKAGAEVETDAAA